MKLVCAFVFTQAFSLFSYAVAHFIKMGSNSSCMFVSISCDIRYASSLSCLCVLGTRRHVLSGYGNFTARKQGVLWEMRWVSAKPYR